MLIRAERDADRSGIAALLAAAFAGPDGHPAEVALVERLRESPAWIPDLSMVAEIDGELVGHCLCTRAVVDETPVLALGPIAVTPGRQGRGIGAAMMLETIDKATDMSERLIGLVGDPSYYRRFGFVAGAAVGIRPEVDAWRDHFQVLMLESRRPMPGVFAYAAPFRALG